MMSTANGAVTISVTSPYQSLRCFARARAPAFGRYPSSAATARTRARVSSARATDCRPFKTSETAVRETPA